MKNNKIDYKELENVIFLALVKFHEYQLGNIDKNMEKVFNAMENGVGKLIPKLDKAIKEL